MLLAEFCVTCSCERATIAPPNPQGSSESNPGAAPFLNFANPAEAERLCVKWDKKRRKVRIGMCLGMRVTRGCMKTQCPFLRDARELGLGAFGSPHLCRDDAQKICRVGLQAASLAPGTYSEVFFLTCELLVKAGFYG